MSAEERRRLAAYLRNLRENGEEWLVTDRKVPKIRPYRPTAAESTPRPASPQPAAPARPASPSSNVPTYKRDDAVRVPQLGGPVPGSGPQDDPAVMALWNLWGDCKDCTRCRLSAQRSRVVPGVGNAHARIMFIGEGPGQDEDRLGEPFVGRAGQLMNQAFGKVGIVREEVYIANMVKCRPPDNRDPQPDEVLACAPWLERQIEAIQPRMFVALGRIAAQNLLRSKEALKTLRERDHTFFGRPFVISYHPAAILRNMDQYQLFEDDLRKYKEMADRLA